ncbi:LOW QUALITY PROTEIN: oligodendrocyte transcription factor 3 [Gambusia affinis]|uniref:LOW QUALITY PROTEIN: oligodendrocyte transcription factor 3 n=1 Tax=Gambusia affinis TaxID=33528 RepID=UPI001CDBA088|nr:LOW QUALITY PROTEIN: oligodendrocyte transcription factor 3 [Gambusia affinis]
MTVLFVRTRKERKSAATEAKRLLQSGMFLRDHHPHHHHHHHLHQHVGSSVTSSTQSASSSRRTAKCKLKKQVTEEEMYQLRLKINGRERKRMHDLNLAMDGLREVMPHGTWVLRKPLSSPLLLARMSDVQITSYEMKRLVGEIYGGQHSAFHCGTVAHAAGASGHSTSRPRPPLHPLAASSTSSTLSSALPGLTSMRAPHALLSAPSSNPALRGWVGPWGPSPCPQLIPSTNV